MSKPKLSLGEIAQKLDAKLIGNANKVITGMNSLTAANQDELSVYKSSKFKTQLQATYSGAVILQYNEQAHAPCDMLIVDDPHYAYAQASALFAAPIAVNSGIDASAKLSKDANIAHNLTIGANALIDAGAQISSGCYIGANSIIGKDCILYPNVTIYHDVQLGDNCIVHSGAVIGADGFGFAPHKGAWHKIHQLGGVRVGNNVEIGSNSTIDRASLDNTYIEDGVKIDSQVHIGHNVIIKSNSIIAGNTAIGGSSTIGKNCIIGGCCGIVDNICITDNVTISGATRVDHNIQRSGRYTSGGWALEHSKWKRSIANLLNLDKLSKRVSKLESTNI
jgi:UDP-3-O-[3-hydroxymyristoyl] glucosamine N-acyltransferase